MRGGGVVSVEEEDGNIVEGIADLDVDVEEVREVILDSEPMG